MGAFGMRAGPPSPGWLRDVLLTALVIVGLFAAFVAVLIGTAVALKAVF